MGHTIIKGAGVEGYAAEVDDHGRLSVKSSMISHMSHHSTYHKNGYRKVFKTTLAGTSETACAFVYNSDQTSDFEIYKVLISSDGNADVSLKVGETYTSGGTLIEMVNTNLSVSTLPTALTYEGGAAGDLALAASNSREMNGEYLAANQPYEHNYEGGLVLTPRTGFAIHITGVANQKIKITIEMALHVKGTKL